MKSIVIGTLCLLSAVSLDLRLVTLDDQDGHPNYTSTDFQEAR